MHLEAFPVALAFPFPESMSGVIFAGAGGRMLPGCQRSVAQSISTVRQP